MRKRRKGWRHRRKTSNFYELIGEEEQTSENRKEKERDRGPQGENSYLAVLIGEEEQMRKKKRKGIKA